MIFYETILKSSAGDYFGSDNLEIETFTAPKEVAPTTVYLFNQMTHRLIGIFSEYGKNKIIIENIDLKKGPFFIIAHDPSKKFNGVIADNIGGQNVDS